jgi:signal transduction histidine kinase
VRSRLLAAFVGLGVAIVLLFGIPRGIAVVHVVETDREALLGRTADLAVLVITDADRDGEQVTDEMLLGVVAEGERLQYQQEDGPTLVVAATPTAASADDLTAERTLPGLGSVTVFFSRAELDDDVRSALTPLILLGVGLVLFSVLVGFLGARRLSRPFTQLAGVADDVGRGRLDTQVPRFGMREADVVGRVLGDISQHLRRLVRREREVTDHASHDLRTPITALRLALEDLAQWPETSPPVAAELRRLLSEVDRLSDAVTKLVDDRTHDDSLDRFDLTRLVRDVVDALPPEQRSRVRLDGALGGGRVVEAELSPEVCRRAVGLLVEHATSAADGEVVVGLLESGGHLRIEIRGATVGSPARDIVWDQAVGTALDLGGRLTVTNEPSGRATWTMILPRLSPSTNV